MTKSQLWHFRTTTEGNERLSHFAKLAQLNIEIYFSSFDSEYHIFGRKNY